MKYNSGKTWLFVPAIAAAIGGCRSRSECIAQPEQIPATIVSISGPQQVQTGQQVTLTIGVKNRNRICVKEADAYFYNKALDTLMLSADLFYLPEPGGCDCKRDSIIYTLLYFTPLNDGTYTIVTAPDSTASTAQPADNVNFRIVSE